MGLIWVAVWIVLAVVVTVVVGRWVACRRRDAGVAAERCPEAPVSDDKLAA